MSNKTERWIPTVIENTPQSQLDAFFGKFTVRSYTPEGLSQVHQSFLTQWKKISAEDKALLDKEDEKLVEYVSNLSTDQLATYLDSTEARRSENKKITSAVFDALDIKIRDDSADKQGLESLSDEIDGVLERLDEDIPDDTEDHDAIEAINELTDIAERFLVSKGVDIEERVEVGDTAFSNALGIRSLYVVLRDFLLNRDRSDLKLLQAHVAVIRNNAYEVVDYE